MIKRYRNIEKDSVEYQACLDDFARRLIPKCLDYAFYHVPPHYEDGELIDLYILNSDSNLFINIYASYDGKAKVLTLKTID